MLKTKMADILRGIFSRMFYRAEKKSLQILLSSTQAGPGRIVKQEQDKISRNHVPRPFVISVHLHGLHASPSVLEAAILCSCRSTSREMQSYPWKEMTRVSAGVLWHEAGNITARYYGGYQMSSFSRYFSFSHSHLRLCLQ